MSNRRFGRGSEETSTPSAPSETQPSESAQTAAITEVPVNADLNYTMFRHNNGLHPDGRASYTIPGVKGNMVIFPTLLASGKFPETLELFTRDGDGTLQPVALASAIAKVDKSAEAAAKLQLKADKAAAKVTESIARAEEKKRKAEEAVAAAKARIAAAAPKPEVVTV